MMLDSLLYKGTSGLLISAYSHSAAFFWLRDWGNFLEGMVVRARVDSIWCKRESALMSMRRLKDILLGFEPTREVA